MRKCTGLFLCVGLAAFLWQGPPAEAGVVIKVRALNPLETEETVLINYPLPAEIGQGDILQRKITYSLDHSEDENPPKADFQVAYSEDEGIYFINDEVALLPREVATLEVHVRDVWMIEEERIETLRREVEGLFDAWAPGDAAQPAKEDGGEGNIEAPVEEIGPPDDAYDEETRQTALMMKEEIMAALDGILARQWENGILKVGVEGHIAAHNDNIKSLLQVRQDIALLTALVRSGAEDIDEEGAEMFPDEGEITSEPDEPAGPGEEDAISTDGT